MHDQLSLNDEKLEDILLIIDYLGLSLDNSSEPLLNL